MTSCSGDDFPVLDDTSTWKMSAHMVFLNISGVANCFSSSTPTWLKILAALFFSSHGFALPDNFFSQSL